MSVSKQKLIFEITYNQSVVSPALLMLFENVSTEEGFIFLPVFYIFVAENIIKCLILPLHCPVNLT